MSKGKFANKHRKNNSSKLIVALLTIVLVLSIGIGGTLAWLTAQTTEVTNTFTTSDINVELNETKENFQMIPGWTIDKDPKAMVKEGSEDSYLFVQITSKNGNITMNENGTYSLGEYIVYAVDSGWTPVDGAANVFYKVVDGTANKKGTSYSVLGEGEYTDKMGTEVNTDDETITWEADQVAVKPSVTKAMMNSLTEETQPKLIFQAYAVQLWKSNASADDSAKFTPTEAWAKVNTSNG